LDGINILEGPNGTGKTTFSELLYFGLGGRVESFQRNAREKHAEITSDTENYVELEIEAGGNPFKLRRFIDTNDVGIEDASGRVEVLPVIRSQTSPRTFSDWLLERLQIEPVTVFAVSDYSGKISFNDLARLIYHDQSPDPSGIYRAADNTSFVSDSKAFRKAVFEILAGKSFQELYASIARLKDLEKKRVGSANTLETFKRFIDDVRPNQEDLNLIFLERRIGEVMQQLERASEYRKTLTKMPQRNAPIDTRTRKSELLSLEMESTKLSRQASDLLSELGRLERLKSELILEVTQIRKMIFAHDKLNLFSTNTCPYCLREVDRELNRCVCGSAIDESKYEKFFYDSGEYLTILKSKQRNVDTIDDAIGSCQEEMGEVERRHTALAERAEAIKTEIASLVENSDALVDISKFDEIDQHILTLRGDLASLEQQKELETRRQELEQTHQANEVLYEAALAQYNELQAKADREMAAQRQKFSAKYDELMRLHVQGCRTAGIDSDYVPILNAGEYREASAKVPKRLFYYLTLLYLSLDDPGVGFPRFLLIDTPETAGIDLANFIGCLEEVRKVVDSTNPPECQVILTTGIDKYPPSCRDRVFATLSKTHRLLRPRQEQLNLSGSTRD